MVVDVVVSSFTVFVAAAFAVVGVVAVVAVCGHGGRFSWCLVVKG